MRERFDAGLLSVRGHRPWPMPSRPWVGRQRWHHLLFAHWPMPVEALTRLVPPPLTLDTYEGRAWVGLVAFDTSDTGIRRLPPVPGLRVFPELNVRTYVRFGDAWGVWFLSLDAGSRLAVRGARWLLRLPYHDALMHGDVRDGAVHYSSARIGARASFAAVYAPVGPPRAARPGSLEHFLTERYALFTRTRHGEVRQLDIHHPPWPLQPAEADIRVNSMGGPLGLSLAGGPLLHYARRQDMVAWWPR